MTTPIGQVTSGKTPSAARQTASVGFATPPSFRRALLERGLLVQPESSEQITSAWAESPDLWVTVMSIYESHLRRVAMEQAFAGLRGERAQ